MLRQDNTMTNDSVANSKVVTDPRPFSNKNKVETVDTSKMKLADMTELDALFNASIEAKPLMMPEGLNIIVKQKEFAYRWVEFKSRGGDNLSKFKYMGFNKATLDDVTPSSEVAMKNPDGIIVGDLILMKIPKDIYFAHLKENYRRANIAASMNDMKKLRENFPTGIPRGSDGNPLIDFYKPTSKEIAGKIQV